MSWLCKSTIRKLALADEKSKRIYDQRLDVILKFKPGDLVLVKNRG